MKKFTLIFAALAMALGACNDGKDPGPGPDPGPVGPVYSVDDLWPDDENPQGIVFWIDPASSTDGGQTGTAGWVMGLKQAPELAWCSNRQEADFGTNSDIDGRQNWEAIQAYDAANEAYTGTFAIFEWCKSTYGEPWYIPSLQEMRRFCAAYMGLTPEQAEAYMNGRRQFNLDQTLGAGTWAATEDHRKAYDEMLAEAGGDKVWDDEKAGPQLWTSTKYDADRPELEEKPWYTEFLGGWGSSTTQGQHDGHYTRAMRRFGAETALDQLNATPLTLEFGTNDTSVKTVNVTKTAAKYDATWQPPYLTPTWIHINKSADSFTVTVDEYTETEAEHNNWLDRQGWITVSAGYAPVVTVTVTQTAPPAPPIDFAGTWSWTGEIWEYLNVNGGKFTPQSGTVTAAYDEDLGYWIFSTLPENQAGSTNNGKPRVDGAIALRVDANNKVTFVPEDELNIWADFGATYGNPYRGYYNFVTFYSEDKFKNVGTSVSSQEYGLPAEHVVEIPVSADRNQIIFPYIGNYNYVECYYGFGFGVREITSLTDHSRPSGSSPTLAGGVYRGLEFTRVQ